MLLPEWHVLCSSKFNMSVDGQAWPQTRARYRLTKTGNLLLNGSGWQQFQASSRVSCLLPQVYGHRMSCWEEHLGCIEDAFQTPQDVNCVRRVRKLAAVRPVLLWNMSRLMSGGARRHQAGCMRMAGATVNFCLLTLRL